MHTLAPRALAHLPFYEALASLDDASVEWRMLSAGLLSLRLFDRWIAEERDGRHLSRWEVSGVAEAVDAVPSTTTSKSILTSVVAAMSEHQSPRVVLPMLAAYGRALQLDARWSESADVLATIVAHAEAVDTDLAMSSAFQRGRSLRMSGDLEAAVASYELGRHLATREGSLSGMLQADVSLAAVAAQRGNLPAAEVALDAVITQAEPLRERCAVVLSKALHDRGLIALRRQQLQAGVGFLNRALQSCDEPAERDRILSDMGSAFFRLGAYDAARDAHTVTHVSARHRDLRSIAAINLLEIAAKTDNEPSFERYRRELNDAPLTPQLKAHFHMYVAEGFVRFDRFDEAAPELNRAVELAEQHSLNDVLFEAESRLSNLRRPKERTAWTETEQTFSVEVQEAAHAVRELRESALSSV